MQPQSSGTVVDVVVTVTVMAKLATRQDKKSVRRCSVVRAVVLALGIQEALPVPGLVGLLGVRVHEHLDIAGSQQATLAHLEDLGVSENSGVPYFGGPYNKDPTV